MPLPMFEKLSDFWRTIQRQLFPSLSEDLGPLSDKHRDLIARLEVVRIEETVPRSFQVTGRPPKDRVAIARAFVAKAVYDLPTTRQLIERVHADPIFRRICGWERKKDIPSESVFSRAFAELAEHEVGARAHERLIENALGDRIVGHISRDSTAIEAREKPIFKPEIDTSSAPKPQKRRGRPRKGEERPPKEPSRLDLQLKMTFPEMIEGLPTVCDRGTKRNSKGHQESWNGYKLHIDTADGQIPISVILTSASVHDSQVAIPLATLTAQRVTSLYDLMDSAYDAPQIREYCKRLGHVPLIDINPRRDAALKEELKMEAARRRQAGIHLAEEVRYNERTTSERVNARLKDEYGGRHVRVRGACKVACHLMFGILVLTADQLLRLVR